MGTTKPPKMHATVHVPGSVPGDVPGDDGKNTNELNGVPGVPGNWHNDKDISDADASELLDIVVNVFNSSLALPPMTAEAMALWTVFTHCFDTFDIAPRLALVSPMPACGKTTALTILNRLTHNPLLASNTSSAAIYRLLEKARYTLLLDELDTYVSGNDALRGILNSGHTRDGATALRNVRSDADDWEAKPFSTWAPVAMAMIGKLPDTWASRSIIIHMRRKRRDEKKIRLVRADHVGLEFLQHEIAKWASGNVENLREANPEMPPELSNREADNWRPLLTIADRIGGHWPETARKAALLLSGQSKEDPSRGEALLASIKRVFKGDRMSSSSLCNAIRADPDDDAFKRMDELSLSKQLRPFGIKPAQMRIGGGKTRGYQLDWFEDAFARYLP